MYTILLHFFFFLMIRRQPRSTQRSTLFPYTTLFRSGLALLKSAPDDGAQPSWLCPVRSEEHTSELQSRYVISYAVFCLKKKKITDDAHIHQFACFEIIDMKAVSYF